MTSFHQENFITEYRITNPFPNQKNLTLTIELTIKLTLTSTLTTPSVQLEKKKK